MASPNTAKVVKDTTPQKPDYSKATDGTKVIHDDPWLEPCKQALIDRHSRYAYKKKQIEDAEGSLLKFSEGYKKYGFNRVEGGITYREWVPAAEQVYIMGEFNDWNRRSHELKKDNFGTWEIFLPDRDGRPAIQHKTKVKTVIITKDGQQLERIPAWIKVMAREGKHPLRWRVLGARNSVPVEALNSESPRRHPNLRMPRRHVLA